MMSFSMAQDNFLIFEGDTINLVDENGFKQGSWLIFRADTDQIKQKGKYINNKKSGLWITYHKNGTVKSEIHHVNNIPKGYAKIYREDGTLLEEGYWNGDKWTGQYRFYHENGNTAYLFNYDSLGMKNGVQKYFHENGNVKISGVWKKGEEDGILKMWDQQGSLIGEKQFKNGQLIAESINRKGQAEQKVGHKQTDIKRPVKADEEHPAALKVYEGTGYNKLYNHHKKIDQEGTFINGFLYDGKKYIYDDEGHLIRTIIIKDGKKHTIEPAEEEQ
jgi:antitoxin component YwqK of YwqJK toxin-antitoxin module